MSEIADKIREGIKQFGYKFSTVAIKHLPELQEAVRKLIRQGLVDKQLHQNWDFYQETRADLPAAKTIIIVAMPQPINRFWFQWRGASYSADIPPTYFAEPEQARIEAILNDVLQPAGYKLAKARVALKTLAVRSGLARYGRNNISYIAGMGSFYRLVAFYTDCPCEEDNWQEAKMMKACAKCSLCRESCPTGIIPNDRFLIHAEHCLSQFNEAESNFPDWIKPDWHNALIGCLRCQLVCPVNKPNLGKIAPGSTFSEEETALILKKLPLEKMASQTRQKLSRLVDEEIYPVMARNLNALIAKQGQR
jgi:epoxyqueuosine reductase